MRLNPVICALQLHIALMTTTLLASAEHFHAEGNRDGQGQFALPNTPGVLGFSGAGWLPARDPEKLRQFLNSMGYGTTKDYFEAVVSTRC